MDAIVQLLRNALCCVKDWELFPQSFLWDKSFTQHYYRLPEPLNETTPLEIIISITQYYAFASCVRSGWKMMSYSLGKFHRLQRIMVQRNRTTKSTNRNEKDLTKLCNRIIDESLVKESALALRSLFIGFNVLLIGVSFFWLFANSWHVTETAWLGGIQGLIHALTVMELCLVALLYYMWCDGSAQLSKAHAMSELANDWQSLDTSTLTLEPVQWLTDWNPYWTQGVSLFELDSSDTAGSAEDEKEVARECNVLKELLIGLFPTAVDNKHRKAQEQQVIRNKAESLRLNAVVTKWEGYREYLYFVLNFAAFYGYLLGILTFYYEDDTSIKDESLKNPALVRHLKLGMSNADADWRGNFVGDLMWTLEPSIILLSSAVFQRWRVAAAKSLKVD